ncbi:hypothetical protein HII31_07115 [Pseudocercospora fuligena]|uniref:Uncharacterized protein n=1 Tax=Pseudocercospora fuligena TaxID=685502 RepID=A0A8H6RIB2_9PEZI|nr:hypothetical protein HII31_07115 [Pseudocercospora fuligena]
MAPVADMLGPARSLGASARSSEGVNNSDNGNDRAAVGNAIAAVLSDKAQGKQRAVNEEPEPEPAPESQLDTQAYPRLTSDIQAPTPSSQADKQWALQEAEKVFARQAQEDPAWTDDDGSGTEEEDDLVFVGQKRRSPTPELPSAAPLKRGRSNDRRETYRSRNRRYETLRSPKSIQQRDQLLAAITRNWNGNIRLAIPEDIGPRTTVGTSKHDVPAQARDWATCSLEAAKVLSEISKGDPESAQRALRRVVMTPGRERTWLSNPQDFIAAAKLLNEDAVQGPKSPSVALSEDISSRLFVTPTPHTTDMDLDDVEIIGRAEDELSREADVVADDLGENKSIRDLLVAHGEAAAREAVAKQRKQDLIEGAFNAERGPEILKAWEEEDAARIQKERLEKEIEMLFGAWQA